ncbi:MAG: DUF11 domain-containing protein, partial [Acidobacteria bacterium]|nr:DUF11 domain-containing protein [Acidobacteriota bacterium]
IGAGEFVVNDAPFPPTGTTLKTGTVINAPGFSCNTLTAFPCTATSAMSAGASATIKFTVTVNANFNNGQPGGFITNTATVNIVAGSNAVDPVSANNASTVNTPIGPSADLAVTKAAETLAGGVFGAAVTAGGTTGDAGGFVTGTGEILYTINFRNNGQGDARNVHIRDVVPAGTLLIPNFAVPNITTTGTPVTCSVGIIANIPSATYQIDCVPTAANGVLAAGQSGTIVFRVRVPENIPDAAVIKNTATINSEGDAGGTATPDPNGGNNTSNETQNIVRTSADLAITKAGPASVIAGNNITYTLTVTNNGPSNAKSVVVTDALPAGVTFVSAASSSGNAACTNANNTVTCKIANLIAPAVNPPALIPPQTGSNIETITIVGKVGANVANSAVLANSATVASATSDPVAANNTSNTVNTTVATDSAVTIVKTDNPDPVVAGTNLAYTITVNNNGPSDAQAVSVVDTLPPTTQVQFLSAVGTGVFSAANSCSAAGNVVTCNAIPGGVLPAGASANITIVVKVLPSVPPNALPQNPDDPAGLLNTVVINWSDSNGVVGPLVAQNATSTQRTTVRHESDMFIRKDAPDFVIAGTRFDIRLTFGNRGPSDVLGDAGLPGSIVVWDLLPVGTFLANVVPNPFIQPGGPGGFACRTVANQGPANNQTLVLCYNAAGAAGNFPAGANLDIIIKVDTNSNLVDGSNLYNCAEVTLRNTDTTPEIDPNGGGQHDNTNPAVGVPGVSAPPAAPAGALTNASGNNESCDGTVVRTQADLAIGKSAVPVVDPDGAGPLVAVPLPVVGPNVPPGSVNAGGYIRYDVPFGNNGTSDAINVLITDQIAGNTAFVGALATGGVFVPAAQPPVLPFTFTIQAVDTLAPLGPNVNLTCTVWQAAGTQSIYCRPQGNTGLGAPGPYADGVLPAGYNGTLTFFVKVNESTASGTLVSNPANITSGLCPNAGPVPPVFPPSACLSTADPNTSNNTTLPTQTLVISSSNLTVSKIVQSAVTAASNPNQTGPIGPGTPPNGAVTTGTAVLPGTFLTYRLTVTNNGPSDVSNIRLTDVLPSGLETPPGRVLGVKYISVTPVLPSGATFTCAAPTGVNPSNNPQGNGGSLVCTAPLLSANTPNNTAAIDVTVFIDPATKANLVDVATFDATINNFNRPVSGSTTLTTPVAPTSDLALTKTHTNAAGVLGGPVTAGTDFEYQVTITNNGTSAAQMVNLVDTIPAFQALKQRDNQGTLVPDIVIETTPDGNGASNFSCVGAADAITDPRATTSTITCTAAELPPNKKPDGTVNPAGTVRFRIRMRQSSLTPQPAPATQNCVTATSMSTDPVPANNTNICDVVPIIFLSPLTATKTDTPDPVIAGNLLTYVITGSPQGPSAALNFTIEDALPTGTVFISAVASAGATLTTPAVNANGTVKAIWNAAGGTDSIPGAPLDGLTPVGTVRTLTIVVRVCPDFQQIRTLTDAQMCVPNLTNNANIYSDTPPNLVGAPIVASATTTVQAQSDLSIAKSGPASAIPNSVVTYTLTVNNAGPSNANGVTVTDLLPKGFTLVPNSVTIAAGVGGGGVGPAAVSTATDAAGSQTVTIGIGVVGAANQCAAPRATQVIITLQALVPKKHPNIIVTNTATVTSTNCLPETGTLAVQANPLSGFASIITPGTLMLANNRAFFDTIIGPPPNDPGPGSVPGYPATAEISDQKAGSILMYPIYTSDAANPNSQNTRMSITNISSAETAYVHLYLVDGASCGVVDIFLCLTPNQTAAFTAADFDPGQTGYVVAVAVDRVTGLPMAYNCLIGDEFVKFSTGHQANLGAEAVAAVMMFPAGTDTTATTATLSFDGMRYNRLPRILALDNLQSRADQNNTLLIVNAVGGNFTRSGATLVSLFGSVFDDGEVQYSFTQSTPTCQFRSLINQNFPRMITRLDTAIPAGRTGWMKFWSTSDIGMFGASINANTAAASNSGAFNQGHNLHKLTLTSASSIVVPVLTPACN